MIIALVASCLLLVLAAVLRASGASLVRTSRADALHDFAEGRKQAGVVAELLEDRSRIQPSLTMLHSALLVASAVPAAWALTAGLTGWAVFLALVAEAVMVVAVGDVLPRTIGRHRPDLAYRFAPLLRRAIPLGRAATDMLIDQTEEPLDEAAEEDLQERELISSVLEFSESLVREVMVPRTDMIIIGRDATTEEALDLFLAHGFSRIPVIVANNTEDVVGILYAKDLLRLMDEGIGPRPVADLMRDAYFVPETKRVPELLREMQASQVHIAIAVDEFGGIAGLVTIEDLLEELVGEITDEYDREAPQVVELPDGGFLVDARLPVDDLNELLEVELPQLEWDTVGGLVLELAGRVPREGERFEKDGVVLVADRVQGRRVSRVRARRVPVNTKPAGRAHD